MILASFDSFGGFLVGDTETGFTCYAYPTSTHATQAKRQPEQVAHEMMTKENTTAAFCRYSPTPWADAIRAQDADHMRQLHADRSTLRFA